MATDDKTVMVLCSSNNIGETAGKPSNCAECGILVWLSDSSLETLKERHTDIDWNEQEITCCCMGCGFKRLAKRKLETGEEPNLGLPSARQIEEIITHIKKKNKYKQN